MLDKLKLLFYTSWIGSLYFDFLLWKDRKKFKREMKLAYSKPQIRYEISATKIAYDEGVKKIKDKIAALSLSKTKEEYEKVLNDVTDLLNLAQSESREDVKVLREVYLYKDADIKNNTDKAKMVQRRIDDYKDLQRHVEKRKKIRQERKNNG